MKSMSNESSSLQRAPSRPSTTSKENTGPYETRERSQTFENSSSNSKGQDRTENSSSMGVYGGHKRMTISQMEKLE